MSNNSFTRGIGLVFLILGICGFTPLVRTSTPVGDPRVMFHFGYLFNNFAMNWVLAGLFVVIGIAALIASVRIRSSRVFERVLFTLALVLLVCGFTPGFSNMFGLMPLWGFTDGLFLATALFSFYFAFVEDPSLPGVNTPVHLHHHHH
jgi:Domain of unknown function (DUF4383)